jgi:hypothetical protein
MMLAWLYRVFFEKPYRCEHKWEVIEKVQIVNENDDRIGDTFYLQCQKCGDVTEKRFR